MATFATPEELASLLQRDLDRATAELVLDLVEADLLSAGSFAVVAALPPIGKGIGLRAAARLYTNPAGLSSESLDDYRRGMGGNYLTADERAQLLSGGGPTGAFSIVPAYAPWAAS